MSGKFDRMVFNKVHNVLGSSNFIEFFIVSFRSLFSNLKVRLGVFCPFVFNDIKIFLYFELLFVRQSSIGGPASLCLDG